MKPKRFEPDWALEQFRKDHEIEKELATRLRNALPAERRFLYAKIYEEFYERTPHASQLMNKASPEKSRQKAALAMIFLKHFLRPNAAFMEVGCGDCAVSFEVAKHVRKVYGFEVSTTISRTETTPRNFQLIVSPDGCVIPLPAESIDIVFTNQVIEHLHPDDALEQANEMWRILTRNGICICGTPNRINGPHDISKHFDQVATGLHLKEYTPSEVANLFELAGFAKVKIYLVVKKLCFSLPSSLVVLQEKFLLALPYSIRKKVVRIFPFRMLLNFRIVAFK
jgi:SAM-dependent methyltransferase